MSNFVKYFLAHKLQRNLCAALRAFSVKVSAVTFDFTVKILFGENIDMFESGHMQIHNAMTAITDKMVVRGRISVKTVRSVPGGKLLDLTDIGEQRQIAVNRTKADVRKFFSDIQINGLCSRVITSAHKKPQNRFPLPTVF